MKHQHYHLIRLTTLLSLSLLVGCGVPEQMPGSISPPPTGTAVRSTPTTNHELPTPTAMPTALTLAQPTLAAATAAPPPTIAQATLPSATAISDHTALPIILSPAAEAPGGGRLVFSSFHEGSRELYLVNADGSGLTPLTDMPEDEMAPAWSPDGQWIVFHALSHDGRQSNIFKVRYDGSQLTQLTDGPTLDTSAAWSWDGQWIAFLSAPNGDMPSALYKIRADGRDRASLDPYDPTTVDQFLLASSNGQRLLGGSLLSTPDGGYNDLARRMDENFQFSQVVWSPDRQRIAYTLQHDGNDEIYSINADGSGRTRLTNDPSQDWMASWSPDGKRLAFARSLQGKGAGIYTMNADGTGLTQLVEITTAHYPIWSPDGQYLAFVTDYGNINILRIDDSQVSRIPVAASALAWAPR